jgi:hypothetical protein
VNPEMVLLLYLSHGLWKGSLSTHIPLGWIIMIVSLGLSYLPLISYRQIQVWDWVIYPWFLIDKFKFGIELYDTGVYKCVATNSAGSSTSSFYIKIEGKTFNNEVDR